MQRVLQNSVATISATFLVDDVETDPSPDTATVTITRDDGTVLTTSAATTNTGTGTFSYQLTSTHTNLLDELHADWTATVAGSSMTVRTWVQVAGGYLFSLDQARQTPPLDDTATYPAAKVQEYRTLAEEALEEACGQAFVPRYNSERVDGDTRLTTIWPNVRAVRSVTIDGSPVGDLSDVVKLDTGVLYRPSGWPEGVGNVIIRYEHGMNFPPARVSQAALTLAKNWLVKGPLDDRMTSLATEDGTFALLTPGVRGVRFGIPEVDAVVAEFGGLRRGII